MALDALFAKNAEWAKTWKNPFDMGQLHAAAIKTGSNSARSATPGDLSGTLILTCLDPRCVPEQYFGPGLRHGVIRNAGGRATQDAINSITAIRSLVGVATVVVVHHTDCGMTHLTDAQIHTDTLLRTPDAFPPSPSPNPPSYGCFPPTAFEDAIKDDVRTLRAAKVLDGVQVFGVALDLEDGRAREVVV